MCERTLNMSVLQEILVIFSLYHMLIYRQIRKCQPIITFLLFPFYSNMLFSCLLQFLQNGKTSFVAPFKFTCHSYEPVDRPISKNPEKRIFRCKSFRTNRVSKSVRKRHVGNWWLLAKGTKIYPNTTERNVVENCKHEKKYLNITLFCIRGMQVISFLTTVLKSS